MSSLSWTQATGLATAVVDAELATHVAVWRPDQLPEITTAKVETAVILLTGTFDLAAGPVDGGRTTWPARGARTSPFQGRPMALFLPPQTVLSATGGEGEILLFAACQLETASEPAEGREALSQSPLLPLAGSGKAFNPETGEWMPEETFPTSAESLPPRRMRRRTVGDVEVERVFAADYKAATLTVDETVIQPGQSLTVAAIDERPAHRELLVFCRDANGDRADCHPTPNGNTDLVLTAADSPLYVALAYAGK